MYEGTEEVQSKWLVELCHFTRLDILHLSLSNSAEFNAGINASTDSAQNKIYWLALAVLWSAACQG